MPRPDPPRIGTIYRAGPLRIIWRVVPSEAGDTRLVFIETTTESGGTMHTATVVDHFWNMVECGAYVIKKPFMESMWDED